MNPSNAIDILNRVLAMLEKSFPQYARYSRPYIPAGHERAMQAIQDIAITEDSLAEQISNQIIAMGGLREPADFPMEFTDTHDLGIDYVVEEAMGYQRQDLAELESCKAALKDHPEAMAVVAEVLNIAKRHLKTFEELHVNPGSSTRFGANGATTNDSPVSPAPTPAT